MSVLNASSIRLTDERPNTMLRLRRDDAGHVAIERWERFPDAVGSATLVGFSQELAEETTPDELTVDVTEIRCLGLRFENLGINLMMSAYIGRLIEDDVK